MIRLCADELIWLTVWTESLEKQLTAIKSVGLIVSVELERHVVVLCEIPRKLVLGRNNLLSVCSASKAQRSLKGDSDAPMFPTCALKSSTSAAISKPLLLQTRMATLSLNLAFRSASSWNICRDDKQLSFQRSVDLWNHTPDHFNLISRD